MFSAQKNGSEDVLCKDANIINLLNSNVQIPVLSLYNMKMTVFHGTFVHNVHF